jgi:hypothetical protein
MASQPSSTEAGGSLRGWSSTGTRPVPSPVRTAKLDGPVPINRPGKTERSGCSGSPPPPTKYWPLFTLMRGWDTPATSPPASRGSSDSLVSDGNDRPECPHPMCDLVDPATLLFVPDDERIATDPAGPGAEWRCPRISAHNPGTGVSSTATVRGLPSPCQRGSREARGWVREWCDPELSGLGRPEVGEGGCSWEQPPGRGARTPRSS